MNTADGFLEEVDRWLDSRGIDFVVRDGVRRFVYDNVPVSVLEHERGDKTHVVFGAVALVGVRMDTDLRRHLDSQASSAAPPKPDLDAPEDTLWAWEGSELDGLGEPDFWEVLSDVTAAALRQRSEVNGSLA